MSNRTLIEINHDFAGRIDAMPADFVETLSRYLRSASKDNAQALKAFGVTVVGMRHHSDNFILDGTPDGFPVQYLSRPK